MRSETSRNGVPWRWSSVAAFALAAVFAATSLGGILLPSTYARETASWRAQGIGQDWFDLVLLIPVLVASGARARKGSRSARIVLGGALVYSVYSFVLYAFDVHFNTLFLVYCAGLGVSFFSLAGLLAGSLREDARTWFDDQAPARLAGVLLVVIACLFAALWFSEIVPALAQGTIPASLAEGAFFTNPVHVLDLSLLLPAMIASGVSLARRRAFGYAVGPLMLVFNVLMPVAIIAMFVAMRAEGVPTDLTPVPVLAAIVFSSLGILVSLLRHVRTGDRAASATQPAPGAAHVS
jgi:hypothetical protein